MSDIKTRLIAIAILLLIILFFHFKLSYYSAIVYKGALKTLICVGEVEKIDTSEQVDQILTMKLKSGWFRGERITVENKFIGSLFGDRILHKGDKLFMEIPLRRPNQERIEDAYPREYVRTPFLLYLAGALGCLLIIVGGVKGVRTILSLFTTSAIILYLLVPLLLKGYNPILVAVIISSIVTLFKFVWITGKSPKVISGTLGTLGGLAACALLATYSKDILHFTGLDEKFGYLKLGVALWRSIGPAWDYQSILAAGMIVGAVGAMMDVAMSISSSVVEVKKANPNISVRAAIGAGFNVGKDIMGTMTNTLIFAYLGAEMVLMVLPSVDFPGIGRNYPFMRLLNREESPVVGIVQGLIGTIGLVLTIPITATIAGFLTKYIKPTRGGDVEALSLSSDQEGEKPREISSLKSILRSRWTVPIALFSIIVLTQSLYYWTERNRAVIFQDVGESGELSTSEYVKGKVKRVLDSYVVEEGGAVHQILDIKILGGDYQKKHAVMRNVIWPGGLPLRNIYVKPGDTVLCKVGGTGKKLSSLNLVHGYSRDGFLVILLGLLMLLIVLIGRNQGIRTAFSLIIAGTVVYFIMMPLITKGKDPVLVTTLTCAIIASSSLLIIVGQKRKTYAAILGTISGVIIASIIVIYAQEHLHFSGLENSIAADIIEATGKKLFDFKKLLLAGMLMGVLGVAMDGAIEVASSMEEIRRANPRIKRARLIGAGMTVGTDVLGTMVNTLLFAYFGLRLLLILTVMAPNTELFVSPLGELLSVGVICAEVVRLLAGTIGIVITIPITALISGFIQTKRGSNAREN